MPDYFLGLDGGGTKTTAELADESGRILYKTVGDSINYYSEGLEKSRNNFSAILNEIKLNTNITGIKSLFIGMSALYGRANEKELSDFTRGICDSPNVNMDSDLFIALESMLCEGECAVVISGTGSMAVGRKANGETICRGGYGYILGDEGSGYKIGLEGIKRAITSFEKTTPETLLTGELLKKFAVCDAHDLIDIFYDPPIERKVIADFARQVLYCAETGKDPAAIEIIETEAKSLALTAASLLREFGKAIPLGVYGGIFSNYPIYYNAFRAELCRLFPGADAKLLEIPPVRGAILAAMKESGLNISDDIKRNIKKG